jgi:hypothetical protein
VTKIVGNAPHGATAGATGATATAPRAKKIAGSEDILKSVGADIPELKKSLAGLKASFGEKYPADYGDKKLAGKLIHPDGIPDGALDRWADKFLLGYSRAIVQAIARDLAQ